MSEKENTTTMPDMLKNSESGFSLGCFLNCFPTLTLWCGNIPLNKGNSKSDHLTHEPIYQRKQMIRLPGLMLTRHLKPLPPDDITGLGLSFQNVTRLPEQTLMLVC